MNDSLTDWIVRATLAPTDHEDPSTPAADTAETISGSIVSVREAAKKVLFCGQSSKTGGGTGLSTKEKRPFLMSFLLLFVAFLLTTTFLRLPLLLGAVATL